MRNVAELGISAAKPAPSPQDLEEFQRHYQVRLPEEYLHFLSIANGGYPEINGFDYITETGYSGNSAVSSFFWLTRDHDDQYGVWSNTELLRKDMEEANMSIDVVAIGENGGNDLIFLDMATNPNAVYIHYWASENSTPKIANTFAQFIDELYEW